MRTLLRVLHPLSAPDVPILDCRNPQFNDLDVCVRTTGLRRMPSISEASDGKVLRAIRETYVSPATTWPRILGGGEGI